MIGTTVIEINGNLSDNNKRIQLVYVTLAAAAATTAAATTTTTTTTTNYHISSSASFKEALSVLMLCAPVFIFTSGSSALLGRPHCGFLI